MSQTTHPSNDSMHALIAERAYFIAEREGFAPGREQEFWAKAEAEVLNDAAPAPATGAATAQAPVVEASAPQAATLEAAVEAPALEVVTVETTPAEVVVVKPHTRAKAKPAALDAEAAPAIAKPKRVAKPKKID